MAYRLALLLGLVLFIGCAEAATSGYEDPTGSGGSGEANGDTDVDTDTNTDTDTDADRYSDSAGNTDDDEVVIDDGVRYDFDWPFDDYAEGAGMGDDGFWGDDGTWYQNPEMCIPPPFPNKATCKGEQGLFARALQMALWFYNINKSGEGVYCTDVQWRGDAHLSDAHFKLIAGDPNGVDMSAAYIETYRHIFDPDGNGEVDLSGGYYDAGDYIKFGITTAFMASTIAWSLYEFPEAYYNTGLAAEALDQIAWSADWFMKSTFIEDKTLPVEQWNVIGYAHQNGHPADHACGWHPPELRRTSQCPRGAYFATHENPGADVSASAAAALALTYLVMKDSRPDYANKARDYAIALYNFASLYPDTEAEGNGGLYTSEYAYDDLGWAAAWLYEATGNEQYFEDAVEWCYGFPGFDKGCVDELIRWESYNENNACWYESWTHVWNSLRSGLFVRLAVSMTKAGNKYAELYKMIARMDTMGWVDGPHSPQGYAKKMDVSWGSARYNAGGQLVAMVYAKHFPEDRDAERIKAWAIKQARYILGENQVNGDPEGKSFMMGFTDLSPNYPLQPHHAAGHASIYGEPAVPVENRHILWGALVNGPSGDDIHIDNRDDYGSNEVTIDFNAAWVGALAGNYVNSGAEGCPDSDFPPPEDPIDEFYALARWNVIGECRSQVEITVVNESIHPPRFNEFLEARYYMDVTELIDAGIDPSTITVTLPYDNSNQKPTTVEGPFPCEKNSNMWYFKLNYEGQEFWGRQSWLNGPRVSLVDFGVGSAASCDWDVANDWSFQGLTQKETKTRYITVYGEKDKLLWGEEPECHKIRNVIYVE
ncbi:MAG: glycoside hydrolase family 9 protein [Deltaproteobacteria bacterium]|nr:glycoside hydrolase family 9 protein [Deltaproteobacteria bacterium]